MTKELLHKILLEYGISNVISCSKIEKGLSSENYKIETDSRTFFLKKHRPYGAKRLLSIEQAEAFFHSNGIPIVVPIKTTNGNGYVISNEDYYVLYPFVSGVQYESGNITKEVAENLGDMLATAHLLTKNGIQGAYTEDKYFQLPNNTQIISEIDDLLATISPSTAYDTIAIQGLTLKRKLIVENSVTMQALDLTDRHLCFGDFYPDNIFFDDNGKIQHIFDLDMAGPAPRLFELVRSVMLSCFWYSFDEEKLRSAQHFILAYYKKYPFDKNKFQDAVELYYLKSFYSVWRERAHYIVQDFRTDSIYPSSLNTLEYLKDHRDEFTQKLVDFI